MAVNPRRKARVTALQALYEADTSKHDALEALAVHARDGDCVQFPQGNAGAMERPDHRGAAVRQVIAHVDARREHPTPCLEHDGM